MPTLESIYMELINYRRNRITTVDLKVSPWDIQKFLASKGFDEISSEANGWQHDFTIEYKKDDVIIKHTGSWYYGSSILEITQKKEN